MWVSVIAFPDHGKRHVDGMFDVGGKRWECGEEACRVQSVKLPIGNLLN